MIPSRSKFVGRNLRRSQFSGKPVRVRFYQATNSLGSFLTASESMEDATSNLIGISF